MTFAEIQDRIAEKLGIPPTSSLSLARIGRAINDIYREVTTSIGLDLSRREVPLSATTTPGIQTLTFTGCEKLEHVYDDTSGSKRQLDEITFDQMQQINPAANDTARRYAIESWTATTITIRLDILPQTAFALKAVGFATADTLSGTDVPAFPVSFHDILIDGVLVEEYMKQEKIPLADRAQARFEKRISDLRMWRAKSISLTIRQAETRTATTGTGMGSGSGGSAPSGGTSYTQTGLITFDRDPEAPFAVSSGSAMVSNLDAEFLGGMTVAEIIAASTTVTLPASSTDNAIVRWNGSGGDTLQNSGIVIADAATGTLSGTNTGDITLAGVHNYLTLAAQVITLGSIDLASHVTSRLPYANFVAATTGSKLVGIRSGAGGSFEEISLGAGLTMSNGGTLDTTANTTAQTANTVYAGPSSGGAATPGFRALVVADLPITGEWLAEDVQVSAGGGTEQFKLSGIVENDDTQVTANAGGAETTLYSYAIPANTLNSNGRQVVLRAYGTLAGDTDSKTIRVRLTSIAGTVLVSLAQNAAAFTRFEVELRLIRIGSNSQRVIGKIFFHPPASNPTTPHSSCEVTTASETDTAAISLFVTGQGTNASDIIYEAAFVEVYN